MAYQPLEWDYERRYGISLSEAQPQDVPWLYNIGASGSNVLPFNIPGLAEAQRKEYLKSHGIQPDNTLLRAAINDSLPEWMPQWGKDSISRALELGTNFSTGFTDMSIGGTLDLLALLSGGIGAGSEALLGGNSMFSSAAKELSGISGDYQKYRDEVSDIINGNNPDFANQVAHSLGSIAGFRGVGSLMGAGAMALGASSKLGKVINLVGRHFLEALTEAGSSFTESYNQDNARYNDALKAGWMNFSTNAPLDLLHGFVEGAASNYLDDHFLPKLDGGIKKFFRDYIQDAGLELIDENLQETRQQMVENAVKNTFNSKNMSWENYGSKLGNEIDKTPEYIRDVVPVTSVATLISSLLAAGGQYRFKSNNRADTNDRHHIPTLDEINELKAQRDELQSQVEQLRSDGNPEANATIQDVQSKIDDLNKRIQEAEDAFDAKELTLFPEDEAGPPPTGPSSDTQTPSDDTQTQPDDNPLISHNINQSAQDPESYNQAIGSQAQEEIDAGTLTIKRRGKSQDFNVVARNSSRFSDGTVSANRASRYLGRVLEIRNKLGKVIAEYQPHFDKFSVLDNSIKSTNLERTFRDNLGTFLRNGGFLNQRGNIASDGNDIFRQAWDKRTSTPEGRNNFYENSVFPEDNIPVATPLRVTHNGQTHNLTVSSYDFADAARQRNYGTVLDIKDEQGRTVARYSPKNSSFMVAPEFQGQDWTSRIAPTLLGQEQSSNRKSSARDRISGFFNSGEAYNQSSDGQAHNSTEAASNYTSEPVYEFEVEYDGRRHKFTVHNGEFSDGYARHKKLFGNYIEVKDSDGNTVFRYSPSTGKASTKWSTKYQSQHMMSAIHDAFFGDDAVFRSTGFIDEDGNLMEGSDEAKKIFSTERDIAKKALRDRNSFWHRVTQSVGSATERVDNAVNDLFTSKQEKELRNKLYDAIIAFNHPAFGEKTADYLSRIAARVATVLSSYAGISPEAYLADRGFELRYEGDPYFMMHDDDGKLRKGPRKGATTYHFNPKNGQGNALRDANNFIRIFNNADVSTVIHELGHFFLNDLRDLYRHGQLKGAGLKDWNNLMAWFGEHGVDLSDIDLTKSFDKPEEDMTPEEKAEWGKWKKWGKYEWTNAHEMFAVGFEKYVLNGLSPKKRLTRAFRTCSNLMLGIYTKIREIFALTGDFGASVDYSMPAYGAYGPIQFRMSPEVMRVMDHLFTKGNRWGRLKGMFDSSSTTWTNDYNPDRNGGDSYNQAVKKNFKDRISGFFDRPSPVHETQSSSVSAPQASETQLLPPTTETRNTTTEEFSVGTLNLNFKRKSYDLDVVSTPGSRKITGKGIADRRVLRYGGRRLEIRNKKGQVVGEYRPYHDEFYSNSRSYRLAGMGAELERAFRGNINEYLRKGGFLDSNGNLISDGNEEFRRVWAIRRQTPEGRSSFYDDVEYPEDRGIQSKPQPSTQPKTQAKPATSTATARNTEPIEKRTTGRSTRTQINPEQAAKDAKLITPSIIRAYYDTDKVLEDNNDFISQFVKQLPAEERSALVETDGTLSSEGLDRISNALIAKAYGDTNILNAAATFNEISSALVNSAPAIAAFEHSDRREQLSITENITQAVNAIADLQSRHINPSRWSRIAAQSGNYSKATLKLINFFAKNYRDKFAISELLKKYAEIASNEAGVNQLLLFEDGIRSKDSILDEAIDYAENYFGEESYNQALNRDVDLNMQVKIIRGTPLMPKVQAWQRKKSFSKQIHRDILSRFVDGQVINEHTGLTVTLSEQGLDHIINSARNAGDDSAGRTLYQAIPYLDRLVRKAYRVETHNDRKPPATKIEGQLGNLKQVHRFLVPVEFGDGEHVLKLTAKEYETGRAEIDEINLYDMKHAKKMSHPSIHDSVNSITRADGTTGNSDVVSVRDMLRDVNDVDGTPYYSDSENYNQTIKDTSDFILTPKAQRQMEAVRRQYEGTEQWMKAPNWKPTKLTEKQWLAVRTPNFINWFGDWINDPEHASKVLDENGEPLIVYHGTPKGGFSIFNTDNADEAVFFTSSLEIANQYANYVDEFDDYYDNEDSSSEPDIYPVFLNIRNPYVVEGLGRYWNELGDIYIYDKQAQTFIYHKDNGKAFTSVQDADNYIQNKLGDTQFKRYYSVPSDGTTNDIAREAWSSPKNYDGVIIHDVRDGAGTDNWGDESDIYIIHKSPQAKSSERNNGEYSPSDADQYNQTQGTRRTQLSSVLKADSEAVNAFKRVKHNKPKRIGRGNETFLTQDKLEHYDQLAYHGTLNLILGGFDLRYLGNGEGEQAFGWGMYFAKNRATAEEYRYGELSQGINARTARIIFKDGREVGFDNLDTYSGDPAISAVLNAVYSMAKDSGLTSGDDILDVLTNFVDDDMIENYCKQCGSDVSSFKKTLAQIKDISLKSNGNLYKVDIPENDVLFDLDARIKDQPPKVQKAIEKIINKAKSLGVSEVALYRLSHARDGKSFHRYLEFAMGELIMADKLPAKYIADFMQGNARSDMAASLLFNQAGIPGLRYWDAGSRDAQTGTHNFVIWNTDLIKIVGISEDSNENAKDTFRQEYPEGEVYNQFIGPEGGKRLGLEASLTQAQDMLRRSMPKYATWRTTGWFTGKDGELKLEIPDGKLRTDALAKGKQFILNDIYDNELLYKAYPKLRDVKVNFGNPTDAEATYEPYHITIDNKLAKDYDAIRDYLIQGIQFAIREEEDLSKEESTLSDLKYLNDDIEHLISQQGEQDRTLLREAMDAKTNDESTRIAKSLSKPAKTIYRGILSQLFAKRRQLLEGYKAIQADALNAQTRADLDEQGRTRPPYASTPTGTPIVLARSSTPVEAETYNQIGLGRQSSIHDVLDIMQTEQGRKNAGNVWVDYARVSPEEARRISEATGLDINDRYVHTIVGSAITHTLNRHGEGNEQRQDQLHITNADFERIPYIIQNADEIKRGNEKATGGVNDTIVYKKRINGHMLVVEEVRNRRGKLAFYTMRKTKACYDYDLSSAEHTIVREDAKSRRITSNNDPTPEVRFHHALSTEDSLNSNISGVNEDNTETYNQSIGEIGASALDKANGNTKLMDALRDAKRMLKAGKSSAQIWRKTGWIQGKDGKWRMEIPDGKLDAKKLRKLYKLQDEYYKLDGIVAREERKDPNYVPPEAMQRRLNELEDYMDVYLPDIFYAPELYKAYPELQAILVGMGDMGEGIFGQYSPDTNLIELNSRYFNNARELRKTIIHEIQHTVQEIEGFAPGSSPDLGNDSIYRKALYRFDAALSRVSLAMQTAMEKALYARVDGDISLEAALLPTLSQKELKIYDKAREAIEQMVKRKDIIYDRYHRTAGEVEARNAENRAYWGEKRRRRTPLDRSEDVPPDKQIVRRIPRLSPKAETYNQTVIPAAQFIEHLTPEARRQIEAVRKQYKGTDQWLKAPNGKKSNLPQKLWLAVRTPNFKRWFGDWENDPQHASKALDENGEPRIFYRGVHEDIDKLPPIMKSRNPNRPGVFYTSRRGVASSYTAKRGEKNSAAQRDNRVYDVFLNIRNPYIVEGHGVYWDKLEMTYAVRDRQYDTIIRKGFSSMAEAEAFIDNTYIGADLLQKEKELNARTIVRYDRQTKTAIYPSNPLSPDEERQLKEIKDIRNRFVVDQDTRKKTDDIVNELVSGERGTAPNGQAYDGVIFKDINDSMAASFTKNSISDVAVAFKPNQAKSATRNNGEYSLSRDEIYSQTVRNSNDAFLTLEQYQQNMYHDTHNIISGNKFDLHRAGQTEGQEYGYGVYLHDGSRYGTPRNRYLVDGPENDMLLQFHQSLEQQSPQVREKINNLFSWLKAHGITTLPYRGEDVVLNEFMGKTGGELYSALGQALKEAADNMPQELKYAVNNPNVDWITAQHMASSMLLNSFGIPGHRYPTGWGRRPARFFDMASDDELDYNFCVWNTDLLRILGVEGTQDAIDHFN